MKSNREQGREPIAAPNLVFTLTMVALLAVLGKVYSVSGLSTGGAVLILRSTNLFQVLTGAVLSDFQYLSVVIFLSVLSLYMEAEWPVQGRHEREVNLLGATLAVAWLVVITASPWPFGVAAAGAAIKLFASRTGPLHFLAWRGLLGERLKERLEGQRVRAIFIKSLPSNSLEALERGDVKEALGYIKNPPSFAEDELKRVADAYSPAIGVRRTQLSVSRVSLLLLIVAAFVVVASSEPWVSPEAITLTKNSATRTGYVLGTDNNRLVILWDSPRRLELVDPATVASRVLCQMGSNYTTLPELMGLTKSTEYSACPK